MRAVLYSTEGKRDFLNLPSVIRARVTSIVKRLAAWPDVSGAKALRGDWHGYYRIRTGDYRLLFRVEGDVLIVRILHRSVVYED